MPSKTLLLKLIITHPNEGGESLGDLDHLEELSLGRVVDVDEGRVDVLQLLLPLHEDLQKDAGERGQSEMRL